MANEITLLICGTQEGNAGFSELLIVGNTPLAKEDVTYPNQFVSSDYCINVRHTNDYIKYNLLCNPSIIKSVGQSRGGRLSFSLTIKRGYRLLGEKTPFDLLYAIMKEFMGRNMSLSTDGAYTFKPGMYDPQSFKQIISEYTNSLQENRRYILMSGESNTHMVIPNENEIRSFLEDTQYEKLASYNSIWVGTKGVTEGALNLDIPRPQEYSVFVNGVKKGTIRNLERFSETIRAPKPTLKDAHLDFNIEDLRNMSLPGKNPSCEIDDITEVIRLSLSFDSKEFTRTIQFDFSELSEGDKNTVKDSLRLIHHLTSSIRRIHINAENKAEVHFRGDEIEYEWELEGDKRYSYLYSHNSSYELNAASHVIIKKKFKGIVFNNVPLEFTRLNNLTISVKLSYQPQSSKYTLKRGQSDNQMLTYAPDLNLISDEDIESISFGQIEGYSISKPIKYELKENGWLYVTMPSLTKLSEPKVIVKPSGKSDGLSRVLNIDGINEDTTVEVIFTGSTDECLRIIKKFKKGDKPYKGVIELPQKEYIQAIEFRIKGYHPERVTQISSKSSTISVPDLREFEPVTTKEKIMRVIKRSRIIQQIIIFILAFAIGFIVRPILMEYHPVEQETEQTDVNSGSNSANVEGGGSGADSSASSSGEDGESGTTTDQGVSTSSSTGVSESEQNRCNSFISKCEDASLLFTEVSQLKRYINKFNNSDIKPNGYDKLRTYYQYYDIAYSAIQRLGKQENAGGFSTTDSWRETCKAINDKAKVISELEPFRKSLQAIYLNYSNIPSINENYLGKIVYEGIDLSKYNSFEKLKEYKKDNFNE